MFVSLIFCSKKPLKNENGAGTWILHGSANVPLSHGKGSVLGISVPGNFTVRKHATSFGHLRVAPLQGPRTTTGRVGGFSLLQRVNTPLAAESGGQISRVSAHWVLDVLCGGA